MNAAQSSLRPSQIWYIIGAALILVGVVIGPVWLVRTLIPPFSSGKSFLAPCKIAFNLDSPGKYVLWHAAETFFERKWYSSCPELPHGTTIKVLDNQTGHELILTPSLGTTESFGISTKYSICNFWVENTGEYTIEITQLASPRVFVLRKSLAKTVLRAVIRGGVTILLGGVGGAALIIFVAIQRNKAKVGTVGSP